MEKPVNKISKAKILIMAKRYADAKHVLEPLARKGILAAQYLLGSLIYESDNANREEAERWLRAAAEKGHPEAILDLAFLTYEHNKKSTLPKKNRMMLRRAAQLGSANAQRELACFLCLGEEGFIKDEVEGRYWYNKAAEQGHIDAQYNVGLMLLFGEGGEVDIKKALYWLKKSASSKRLHPASMEAAKMLSSIYEDGLFGLNKNKKKARYWLKKRSMLDKLIREQG